MVLTLSLPLVFMNLVLAQPTLPGSDFAPSSPQEVCYGWTGPTIEFVCKDENAHFRAIDCDEVNPSTHECLAEECTLTKGNDCASIRGAYEDWSNNEPRCNSCTTIFPPVHDN